MESNGPLAAQEYRLRNPQTAPHKLPTNKLSHKTRMELLAGRLQLKLNQIEEGVGPCANAPPYERIAYVMWVRRFLEQCRA